MVAILRPFSVDVEDLVDLSRLPSVDDLRPCACPLCGEPSQRPGERLGIVGHGTYLRQVLEASKAIVIRVRRYLCRACRRTISVLPEALLPRRWYAAGAILLALVLSLLLGKTAEEIRRRFAAPGETRGWKTLDRWQRQLFAPLWRWVAAQLGFAAGVPAADRIQRSDRLRRLLFLHGAGARSPTEDEIERVACACARGTAHTRSESWAIGRGR
jgi:hypothetical protein